MPGKNPAEDDGVTVVSTVTDDGVTLSGLLFDRRLDGPLDRSLDGGRDEPGPAIVVGHGFTNHVRRPPVYRILRRLSTQASVLAFDFRGHGRSGGACTVGWAEVLDLAAAVRLAGELGHRRVATLGFSMGAGAVIRHAALHAGDVHAVASVSGPARWWERGTAPIRRLHWLVEDPIGRKITPLLGVRIGPLWPANQPDTPLALAHRIAPTPLLVVHGTADRYFPADHAVALATAAGDAAELWLRAGMRHAETAMTPALVDAIGGWLINAATTTTRPAQTPTGT